MVLRCSVYLYDLLDCVGITLRAWNFPRKMAINFLLLLGTAVIASSIVFFVRRGRRNAILARLYSNQHGPINAEAIPSYSLPSKKPPTVTKVHLSSTFPPSRRFVLAEIGQASNSSTLDEWEKNVVPLETSYLDANDSIFTPCGLSVKETKALGDFPDYAALTGVPLPNPYSEFDIKQALPRPYRPFRWPYHQTMCMCLGNSSSKPR
jgi:hypothetical protein